MSRRGLAGCASRRMSTMTRPMSTGWSVAWSTRRRADLMPTRRDCLAAIVLAGTIGPRAARAQDHPARPLRMIVPYAAGGATDTLARLLATGLDAELKQS